MNRCVPCMIAPDLVESTPAGTRIVAGRRKRDGKVVFPLPGGGDGEDYERLLLSPEGKLWSWTVQRFRPKSPPYRGTDDPFRPFLVGFVEFPEGVVVEGRIDARPDEDAVAIGMPMATTVVPAFTDRNGETVHVHAFRAARPAHDSTT